MRCVAKTAILAMTAAALVARPAPAATADDVDAAIARAQAWLLGRPGFAAEGNWEYAPNAGRNGQAAGLTALVTYSLLASGLSANDPRLRKPIDFLRRAEINGTYAVGLRAQVWQFLPPTVDNATLVTRDLRLLMRNIERDAAKIDGGLFGYNAPSAGRVDLSASQYGTLGLWACWRASGEVSFNTWKLIENRWKTLQDKQTGGWAYGGAGPPSVAITAAGVATLYITLDALAGSPRDDGNAADDAIDRGIASLAPEIPLLLAPGSTTNFYALYGIERIGVAGGYKLLGGIDWYAAGSDFLCRAISADGYWSGQWGAEVDTAFALLFLARGREPVLMNKIKYEQLPAAPSTQAVEGRWNQRGRDVSNAARFIGQQVEQSFNWQILDLAHGTLRDLHDAPIGYLAFHLGMPTRLAPGTVDKLREYVESGGLLVVNADWPPPDRATTRATTQALAAPPPAFLAELFPDATLRPLPADHVILRGQQFKAAKWTRQPLVYELTNGVRSLAIYLADDPGRSWQLGETKKEREKFELIADLYQYAIDKEHSQVKGRTYYVEPPATQPAASKRARVARIRFAGNCHPEPGAWRRLAALAAREGIDVAAEPVELERGSLDAFELAHLSGVGHVYLSPAAVDRLRAFVARGGVLLVDAAGGDATFNDDVRRVLGPLADAFSPTARPIAGDDKLFTDARGGPLRIQYRTFALATVASISKPDLRGTKVNGKWGVLYSPEDLTVGMVGQQVDGIRGYTPDVATAIVMSIVRGVAK